MTCREVVATGRYPYTGRLGILSAEDWKLVDDAMQLVHAQGHRGPEFFTDQRRTETAGDASARHLPGAADSDSGRTDFLPGHALQDRHFIQYPKTRGRKKYGGCHVAPRTGSGVKGIGCDRLCGGRPHGKTGTPEEVFSGDYIQKLYGVDAECFDPRTGAVYLRGNKSRPKIFVIGGAGSGIPVYHALQRKNVPFAAGILMENDVEYQDSCAGGKPGGFCEAVFPGHRGGDRGGEVVDKDV